MVPVDMRGVGQEFEDIEQMIEKLGNKGTAEAFQKAHDFFNKNSDNEPADERPKPMTAKEWREVLEEQDGFMGGEGMEEEMPCGEEGEEEFWGEDAEEEEQDEDGGE